jgi:3-oxoacyl-[acyl-carrier-protein] synthase II
VRPRVAIVAAEVLTALGDAPPGAGLSETWEALGAGRSALRPVRGFDASGFSEDGGPVLAAQLPPEDDAATSEGGARVLGPLGRVLARCAQAVHAAARGGELPREEVGLFVATGMVDSPVEELAPALLRSRGGDGAFDLATFFESGFRAIHPLWPLSTLNNVPVGQVAVDLDLCGDHLVLASEGDAGGRAIEEAVEAIREGSVRAAVVAGVGERVSPASLERRRRRGGPVGGLGEGGGALFLESEASAAERGVVPLARIASVHSAFSAGDPTALGGSVRRVISRCIEDVPRFGRRAFVVERGVGDLLAGAATVEVALACRQIHDGRRSAGEGIGVCVTGSAGGAVALVVVRP